MVDILNEIIGILPTDDPLAWVIGAVFVYYFTLQITYLIRALFGYDT